MICALFLYVYVCFNEKFTKMKKENLLPSKKFLTVWSPELSTESGTIAPVVGVFGMTLADLVIKYLLNT